MFPATTMGTGNCALPGPLDVCKVPAPPAPPIPTPLPNFAMCAQANGGTCSGPVKIGNKKSCTTKSVITMTTGDEPGTLGGMVSNQFKGQLAFKKGSGKVKIEGNPAITLTSMCAHNGNNANVPGGFVVAPSQTSVLFGP